MNSFYFFMFLNNGSEKYCFNNFSSGNFLIRKEFNIGLIAEEVVLSPAGEMVGWWVSRLVGE